METETTFKRGIDLRERALPNGSHSIVCESCGARAESDAAKNLGWQLRPPVCPDCLHWSAATSGELVADRESANRIERRGRHWAVYENGKLLCVTVYRKGAEAVVARLQEQSLGEASHGGR